MRRTWGAVGVALGAAAAAAQPPPALTPAEAVGKVGEAHSVEFVVKSTGPKTKDGRLYLNSHPNPTWEGNFAAVIEAADAGRFPGGAKGLEKFYLGKQVRVTGRIETFKNGPGVRAGPDKLAVTNPNPPRDPLEAPPPPDPVPDDFDPRPPSYLPYYLVAAGLVLLAAWYVLRERNRRRDARDGG
ncbi:MAG: hypothetical protein C0501_16875 [Isosphaera sp.]|nr:hypothetical protein [Isosphaera sp.]